MKTLILSILLIFGITATNHGKPINDIYSIKESIFTDEAYVNDIPFNTQAIAVEVMLEGYESKLENEPNIDDIPFDTKAIACEYLFRKMKEASGEANVKDIPFSTKKIWCEYLAAQLIRHYRDEQNIADLPASIKGAYSENVRVLQPSNTINHARKLEISQIEKNNDGCNDEHLIIHNASF
jgi:hypothetical protein